MPLPTGPFPRAHHVGSLNRPDNLIAAREAAAKHTTADAERNLILVWLVQHAGFAGEGGKSQEEFRKAALKAFGK